MSPRQIRRMRFLLLQCTWNILYILMGQINQIINLFHWPAFDFCRGSLFIYIRLEIVKRYLNLLSNICFENALKSNCCKYHRVVPFQKETSCCRLKFNFKWGECPWFLLMPPKSMPKKVFWHFGYSFVNHFVIYETLSSYHAEFAWRC